MTKFFSRSALPAALTLCLVALFACTKDNAIKLTYALGPTAVPCSGEVVVFKFKDERSTVTLGKDNDNQPIRTASDVADWVGWALFDELRAAGAAPKYRTSTVTPGDAALITGEVLEVSLDQTGTTTYTGKVVVRIFVEKGGTVVHREKFSSQVEDVVMPGYASENDILEEALRGLLAEAVPTVCGKI